MSYHLSWGEGKALFLVLNTVDGVYLNMSQGCGKRHCVGKHMAIGYVKLFIVRLLENFDFEYIGDSHVHRQINVFNSIETVELLFNKPTSNLEFDLVRRSMAENQQVMQQT